MISIPGLTRFPRDAPHNVFAPMGRHTWSNGPSNVNTSGAPGPTTVRENDNYGTGYADVNGVVNRHYFLDKTNWKESHTCPDMLTFTKAKKNEPQRDMGSHEMMSIASLNYHLKYDGRFLREFNQPTAMKLMSAWLVNGYQHDREAPQQTVENGTEPKLLYHYAKKARQPNLWLAQYNSRRRHQEGDECWLLVRRHRIDYKTELQVNTNWSSAFRSNGNTRHASNELPQWYWQYHVYTSINKEPPPLHLTYCPKTWMDVIDSDASDDIYANEDVDVDQDAKMSDAAEVKMKSVPVEGWIGGRLHIGMTHSVYNPEKSHQANIVNTARKVLHPDTDTIQYQAEYFQLPIQIMQQI